jgi:hypothetical protein
MKKMFKILYGFLFFLLIIGYFLVYTQGKLSTINVVSFFHYPILILISIVVIVCLIKKKRYWALFFTFVLISLVAVPYATNRYEKFQVKENKDKGLRIVLAVENYKKEFGVLPRSLDSIPSLHNSKDLVYNIGFLNRKFRYTNDGSNYEIEFNTYRALTFKLYGNNSAWILSD